MKRTMAEIHAAGEHQGRPKVRCKACRDLFSFSEDYVPHYTTHVEHKARLVVIQCELSDLIRRLGDDIGVDGSGFRADALHEEYNTILRSMFFLATPAGKKFLKEARAERKRIMEADITASLNTEVA